MENEFKLIAMVNDKLAKAIKVTVRLSSLEGHIYQTEGGDVLIRAAGYLKLNQFAKISILKPDTLVYRGDKVGNPHYEYTSDGNILRMYVKGIGIGYVVGGGIVINQHTATYDDNVIMVNSLIKVINDFPRAGFMVTDKDDLPEEISYFVRSNKITFKTYNIAWKYYPMGENMGGIMYDIRHPQVTNIMRKQWEGRKNLDSSMSTLLSKHILRTHPAIGIDRVTKYDTEISETGERYIVGYVDMYMWKSSLKKNDIVSYYEDINNGRSFLSSEGISLVDNMMSSYEEDDELRLGVNDILPVEEADIVENKESFPKNDEELRANIIAHIKAHADELMNMDIDKPIYEMTLEELKNISKEIKSMKSMVSIEIKHVKCIEDRKFKITSHNLITGPNGTGKSGIIEAAMLIATGADPSISNSVGSRTSLKDIVGLMPLGENKMEIEAEYASGEVFKREYKKGKDGRNTQTIWINATKMKTSEAEKVILDTLGDFMFVFNFESIINSNEKTIREMLFKAFGDKLSKVDDDIMMRARFALLSVTKEYIGMLQFAYNVTTIDELDRNLWEKFEEAVVEKLPKKIAEHYNHIIEDILPVIPKTDISEFMSSICSAVRTFKNELSADLTSERKALEENILSLDDSRNAVEIEKKLGIGRKQVSDYTMDIQKHDEYIRALAIFKKREAEIRQSISEIDIDALRKVIVEAEKAVKDNKKDYVKAVNADEEHTELVKYEKAYNERTDIENQISVMNKEIVVFEDEIESIKADSIKAFDDMGKLDKKVELLRKEKETVLEQLIPTDGLEIRIDSLVETLGLLKDGICPVCKTETGKMGIDIVVENNKLSGFEKELSKALESNNKISMKILKIDADIVKISLESTELNNNITGLNGRSNIASSQIGFRKEQIQKLNVKISEIKEDSEKFTNEALDKCNKKIKKLSDAYAKYPIALGVVNNKGPELNKAEKQLASLKLMISGMKAPKVVTLDPGVKDLLTTTQETIEANEVEYKLALEAQGVKKMINDLETRVMLNDAAVKYMRRAVDSIDLFKNELIDTLLNPVEARANGIYNKIYGRDLVFSIEQCGVMSEKNEFIGLKYMSGGQKVGYLASILGAIMEATNARTRTMAIEGGELDDDSLKTLLLALEDIDADNIFVATHRDVKQITEISSKWNHIEMGEDHE